MGNPDLVIIINGGEFSFIIKGTEYEGHWRDEVYQIAIDKYNKWANEIITAADKPEELPIFYVRSIETFKISE